MGSTSMPAPDQPYPVSRQPTHLHVDFGPTLALLLYKRSYHTYTQTKALCYTCADTRYKHTCGKTWVPTAHDLHGITAASFGLVRRVPRSSSTKQRTTGWVLLASSCCITLSIMVATRRSDGKNPGKFLHPRKTGSECKKLHEKYYRKTWVQENTPPPSLPSSTRGLYSTLHLGAYIPS